MIHKAEFSTNIGQIKAVWDGGRYVSLYRHEELEPSTTFRVWDDENDKPLFVDARGMASYVREWLWEIERGIDFDGVRVSSIEDIDEPEEA